MESGTLWLWLDTRTRPWEWHGIVHTHTERRADDTMDTATGTYTVAAHVSRHTQTQITSTRDTEH